MTAPWRAVRVESCSDRDGVLAALFDAGAEGVHEDGAALVTHFPPETDIAPVLAAVLAADPTARVTTADAPVVATGGLADLIQPHSRTITAVDAELTLHGLRLGWERNR